jgi:hypothetical protein
MGSRRIKFCFSKNMKVSLSKLLCCFSSVFAITQRTIVVIGAFALGPMNVFPRPARTLGSLDVQRPYSTSLIWVSRSLSCALDLMTFRRGLPTRSRCLALDSPFKECSGGFGRKTRSHVGARCRGMGSSEPLFFSTRPRRG